MDSLKLLTRGARTRPVAAQSGSDNLYKKKASQSNGTNEHVESPPRKKQKLSSDDTSTAIESSELSTDQIRRIQKSHKIKITDLNALQSRNGEGNTKGRKEASRLYPRPLQSFKELSDLGVCKSLVSNLVEQGYKEPTEIQLATIGLLIAKEEVEPNILSIAPTGSGKTLAFLIPLIDKLHRSHNDASADKEVKAIILAPTRELANQIVNEARKLAIITGVRVTLFKKGMRLHDAVITGPKQSSDDSEDDEHQAPTTVKADIVVATPLSLLHAITPSEAENTLPLPNVTNLILDEADVLLDPLFRDQTLSIWSACTNHALRTSLWSATIGSNIEDLTISTIKSRLKLLKIHKKFAPPSLRCIVGLKDSSLPNVKHQLIYATTEAGKLTGIRQLIHPPPANIQSGRRSSEPALRPPFLIFTQSIPRAEALYNELKYDVPPPMVSSTSASDIESVSRIAILHSSLSSNARSKIMQHFRLGKIWILITTDLLSRGIDFRGINGVVNYDIPTTSASYVHRAGRTGRAGRQGSTCITFYTRDDVQYLRPIANVIAKSQKEHGVNEHAQDGSAGIPSWMLDALPSLTKNTKKDIKQRGVDVRRAVMESDDKLARRRKGRNVIGTKSGYEKKIQDRRKGAIEGSRRRKAQHSNDDEDDDDTNMPDFDGFE